MGSVVKKLRFRIVLAEPCRQVSNASAPHTVPQHGVRAGFINVTSVAMRRLELGTHDRFARTWHVEVGTKLPFPQRVVRVCLHPTVLRLRPNVAKT